MITKMTLSSYDFNPLIEWQKEKCKVKGINHTKLGNNSNPRIKINE